LLSWRDEKHPAGAGLCGNILHIKTTIINPFHGETDYLFRSKFALSAVTAIIFTRSPVFL
jgi:hypothetical protein